MKRSRLPAVAGSDHTNKTGRNSKLFCEKSAGIGTLPDHKDSPRREFASGLLVPVGGPALGLHVGHVVGLRAQENVRWITAAPVVTAVQGVRCSFRDASPIRQDPSDSVGRMRALVEHEVAVSFGSSESQPRPAFVRSADIDLFPESFCDRLGSMHGHLRARDRGRSEFQDLPGSAHFSTATA